VSGTCFEEAGGPVQAQRGEEDPQGGKGEAQPDPGLSAQAFSGSVH